VRYALPLRVVERDARTLAVTTALSWGDDYVEPFSLALPPTGDAVYLFLNRRHLYGTGPYPALTGFGDGYDTCNLLTTATGLLAGDEQLLHFGHGDGTPSPGFPYYMVGTYDARGNSVAWAGEDADGPLFLSLAAQNPGHWTETTTSDTLWRFRPTDGGTFLDERQVPYDPTRGAVWRLGPGDFLIQQDSPGRVEWIVHEAFP
jgi:hypothetical protein